LESDDELEEVWKKEHSLKAFIDPTQFKNYDELKEKLNRVLTGSGVGSATVSDITEAPKSAKTVEYQEPVTAEADEDTINYFSKLANE
jgi:hypothetical protein